MRETMLSTEAGAQASARRQCLQQYQYVSLQGYGNVWLQETLIVVLQIYKSMQSKASR